MAIVDGKVVFDETEQAEIDRIIGERLARAKAEKPADYDDLKEIADHLEEFGYSGTPAEKKAAIKAYREEIKRRKELEELQQQAKTEGTSPELLAEIRELKKELAEIKGERQAQKQAEEQKSKQEEVWKTQVKEFTETYPDIDLKTLNEDDDFIEYASGRTGTIKTIYEGYVKLTSKLKEKTAEEVTVKYKAKELGSTGTGKGTKTEGSDYGLSERQKQLAKGSGMSYKEYADLLKYAD